jgi:hypothetical protein
MRYRCFFASTVTGVFILALAVGVGVGAAADAIDLGAHRGLALQLHLAATGPGLGRIVVSGKRGADTLSESGMKWTSSGAKR